jgi:glycosyltransferase involved in cell wall biosynthesis
MKISVIVPTYNRAKILSMAVESLIKQDFNKLNYEIVIVDNNSTDNTKEVAEKYQKENPDTVIRYVFEPSQGLVFARHAGVRESKYDVLSFTDDDGILSPKWLNEIARLFEMNREVVAVAGKILIKWDETPPQWVISYERLLGKLDYGDKIRIEKGLNINGGNFSIRKEVLLQLGGFNPDQIGEWLIGDGEVGLCRKIHNAGYLIGWAPEALMEHYQIVKKNATVDDIRRRYINNGRSVPFGIFTEGESQKELFDNLVVAVQQMRKWKQEINISKENDDIEKQYRAIFEYSYYSCQIPYTFRILIDHKFRELVKENAFNQKFNKKIYYRSLKNQYKVLLKEYINVSLDYAAKCNNLEIQNSDQIATIKALESKCNNLEIQNSDQIATIKALESKCNNLEIQNSDQIATIKALESKCNYLEIENNNNIARIRTLESDYKNVSDELIKLYRSFSYRLGYVLLHPIKGFKKIINKLKRLVIHK